MNNLEFIILFCVSFSVFAVLHLIAKTLRCYKKCQHSSWTLSSLTLQLFRGCYDCCHAIQSTWNIDIQTLHRQTNSTRINMYHGLLAHCLSA